MQSSAGAYERLPDADPALMDEVWVRMSEIYGHRFTSSYGIDPNDTWAKGLHDMTPQEIGHGLAACITMSKGNEWPPNLAEFRAMCRPQRLCAAHKAFEPTSLPKPKNPEVGRASIRGMRETLGAWCRPKPAPETPPANETYFTDPVAVENERERILAWLESQGPGAEG